MCRSPFLQAFPRLSHDTIPIDSLQGTVNNKLTLKMPLIIFVCTSNVCRSPALAGLARAWLIANNRTDCEVISRSLSTNYEPENSPPSEYSSSIMLSEYNIDISSHRSVLITSKDVDCADVIIGVSASHSSYIIQKFPQASKKCIAMPRDIPDPWHGPYELYYACITTMHSMMDDLFLRIDEVLAADSRQNGSVCNS